MKSANSTCSGKDYIFFSLAYKILKPTFCISFNTESYDCIVSTRSGVPNDSIRM